MPILLHGGIRTTPDPILGALPRLMHMSQGGTCVLVVVDADRSSEHVQTAKRAYAELGVVCTVLEVPAVRIAASAGVVRQVRAADLVHMAGGSAPRIANRLRGTALENALSDAAWVLPESGAAMALGVWALGCPDTVDPPARGLSWFADWVIDAHFGESGRRSRIESVLTQNPTLQGLGIEDATALLVENTDIGHGQAIGSGQVHLLSSAAPLGDGRFARISETGAAVAAD